MIDFGKLGFGVMGSLDRTILRELAPRLEAAGFHSLWLNDIPGGDSLAGLNVAAKVTSTLELGTGVIPLDRRPASEILASLERLDLPLDRLLLGIGTGNPKGGLQRVRESIGQLREGTSARIVVGALGPELRKLGAEVSDGLVLNWLTPEAAADAMQDLRDVAAANGIAPVRGILYTRMAADPAGLRNMVAESARYQSYPAYAANFERIGAKAIDTTIYEKEPDRLAYRIGAYTEVLDELVLRAITGNQTLDDYVKIVDAVVAAGKEA
jgi:alkanesulfonate monooxygenase SsuD/methylene tetrahydromethanopterin reductase-like flavin-dependent oxidoreductase (luciferase family)